MAIKNWCIVGLATLTLLAYSSAITTADDGGDSSDHQFKWSKSSAKKKVKRARPSRTRRKRRRAQGSSTRRQTKTTVRKLSGLPPKEETRFKREEVIVQFRLRTRQARRDALAQQLGLRILEAQTFTLAGFTAHRYLVPTQRTVRQTIVELERSADVVYAQPNYIYELQKNNTAKAKPNYAFKRMSLGPVHETTRGSKVKIAVIDSGIDRSHPELASAKIASHDLRDQKEEMDRSHGTSIAGIIGAQRSIAGVAPDADIIGISAFATSSDGKTRSNSWVISKSMDLAHKLGAKVFNLSFAGPGDPIVRRALKKARQEGIVAIAAAGNAGPKSAPLYPAGYRSVIAVSATDVKDAIYENANRGKYVTLSAPGVQILTLAPKASYRISSGTSISTAYVSGLSALLLSANPKLGRDSIERILKKSSTDLGKPGRDEVFGVGIPDAVKALKRAITARR
jgi:subtilisin family serine protease